MSTELKLNEYERYVLDCIADSGDTGLEPPTGDLRKVWRKLHRFGLLKRANAHNEVYQLTTLGEEYRNED